MTANGEVVTYDNPGRRIVGPLIICTLACTLFFGIFGAWAALAPLAGGALAPGVISPIGQRRTVQHLEGGIIAQLLVRDGDSVEAGQPLVVLAETQARASHRIHLDQRRVYSASLARLRAEEQGAEKITFPEWLAADRQRPEIAEILDAQTNLFSTRIATLLSRRDILESRIGQLHEEAAGLRATVEQKSEQVALIDEEITDANELMSKGLQRKPHVLKLRRDRAEIAASRAENIAAIARLAQAEGETRLQMLDLITERREQIAKEVDEIRHRMAEVDEKLVTTKDVLQRTTITAPLAGIVVNRRFSTAGGVIGPGDPILDIVPAEEDLIIEAMVSPLDIDVVHPGVAARVHLSPYAQRTLPQIDGTVRAVSADALVDEKSRERYYRAVVAVDRSRLAGIEKQTGLSLNLLPGMPVEVLFMATERTLIDYLLQPFLDSMRRSFRES